MQGDMQQLPEILMSLEPAVVEALQQNLGKVWHRFMYSSAKLYKAQAKGLQDR
jgi:hypothetical protein